MAIKEENSIGSRIVQAFNAKDLKEAAQMLGENYASLHNWSSKRRDFPTNVLIKIAKMTNSSIDWILTGVRDDGRSALNAQASFENLLDEKIRAVVRSEIAEGTLIHEKIQGIILSMQSNVVETDVFENEKKEEKAA